MATFWDPNKSKKVLIKEKATKRNGLGLQKPVPYLWQTDKWLGKWNVSVNVELTIVFKREHTLYFCFWEVHHDNWKHKPSCRSMIQVCMHRTKNNRTRKSNCLMLVRASKIWCASCILPLITLNSKGPSANKTAGTLPGEQMLPWEDLCYVYVSLGLRSFAWLRDLGKNWAYLNH